MSWQDIVLSAAGIIGVIALFPSILSEYKPATATSILNGSVAIAIAVVDLSLHLLYAAAVAAIITVLWLVLAAQQWGRRRHSGRAG